MTPSSPPPLLQPPLSSPPPSPLYSMTLTPQCPSPAVSTLGQGSWQNSCGKSTHRLTAQAKCKEINKCPTIARPKHAACLPQREDFENQLAILRDQLELLAHTSNNPSGSGVEQGKTLPERPFAGWPFTRNGTASTTPMASNMHTPSIHYQPTPKLSSRGAYPFQNPFASSLPKADIPSSSSSSDFAAPPPRAPARNAEALHAPSVVGQSKAATLVGVARYPSADSDEQAHTASSAVGVVRYPVEANTEPNDQQKCVADANVGAVGVDGAAPRRKRTVITPAQPEEYNLYDVVIELPSAMCSPCISFCDTVRV